MRPVNLIPAEERPGGRRPLRSGPLAYIVVGALAAAVIALTAVVVTEGKISDRKAEVTSLKREEASVEAKAHALASYTQFAAVHEQRLATVTSLADSRFDWERVLHELSLVLPADIQLTSLTGTSAPGVSTAGGAGIAMRSEIAGPALEMVGCATSQGAVAGFVEALKGIDGVTRVGVQGSSMSGGESGGNATTASDCGGSGKTAQFQMVAAFDAAPVPPSETAEEVAPEVSTESTSEAETTSNESSSEESSSAEGGAE
ncbi:MAG TPA: PilN domain-containing protein [Solirubrobacterales bacterium]|jgi:Tfp pilus assembly protein PilN|nr:PilN domain-containing protein [Solirubrobacterales bacterium]